VLLLNLRVSRNTCNPFVKAGFTLLEKRGLVELRKGVYRPAGNFFDVCEEVGLTSDGYATDEAKNEAKKS